MGWSLPYTLRGAWPLEMAAVCCQAVLCYGQRIGLDGARAEAVDAEEPPEGDSASCDADQRAKSHNKSIGLIVSQTDFNWFHRILTTVTNWCTVFSRMRLSITNGDVTMSNGLDGSPDRQLLVDAAKQGAEAAGYKLERIPGRGLSNVWNLEKNGRTQKAAIRTTRDRWIAFPPLDGGKKWKTLDRVELVVVATVDSKENPKNVEVYFFPAKDVRQRFDEALAARTNAGQVNKDNYGMWVALDPDARRIPLSEGSGIVTQYKPVAIYPIEPLVSAAKTAQTAPMEDVDEVASVEGLGQQADFTTIAEVMAWTRERVAEIAGVRVEAVKLDLKLEY
jgi:hypothetical protein